MKKYLMILTFSFCYMQGDISGYTIFDYSNSSGNDGFDIKRAYFSYSSDISEDLFFKIRFDVGRHDSDDRLTTYLKNAYVDWKCENGDKLSMGLIGTNSYGVQENNWGYRFIEKSVLDKYGMTNTADFGVGYSKLFGKIDINVQLLNGEGFKSEEEMGEQAMYLRVLYGESKLNKNDGMNFGIIINYIPYHSLADDLDHTLTGFFGGWASNNLRLGLEYNQFDTFNNNDGDEFTEEASSVYANYSINDEWDIFVRHDVNDENIDDNTDADAYSWVGAVWNPTKGLYISPNVHVVDNTNTYHLTCMFKY